MESEIAIPQYLEFTVAANPLVANIMMSLQVEYGLPIEIICGQFFEGMRIITLRTSEEEETLQWFIDTAEKLYEFKVNDF